MHHQPIYQSPPTEYLIFPAIYCMVTPGLSTCTISLFFCSSFRPIYSCGFGYSPIFFSLVDDCSDLLRMYVLPRIYFPFCSQSYLAAVCVCVCGGGGGGGLIVLEESTIPIRQYRSSNCNQDGLTNCTPCGCSLCTTT